jgi:hypothetical protein
MVGLKHIFAIGGVALSLATLPAPALACSTGCGTCTTTCTGSSGGSTGSTGGTEVPAPAGLGLFAAAALGLVAKRRRTA